MAVDDKAEIRILNCTTGDTALTFDPDNPQDVESAKEMFETMKKRGYSIFVREEDGTMTRVYDFDPKTASYVIKKDGKTKRKPYKSTKSIACAPTAGG